MADSITLTFDLFSMPTAQHKAGLAGMILSIREMQNPQRERGDFAIPKDEIPIIDELSATSATITLTEASCQRLFDECYAARPGQAQVRKPWDKAKLIKSYEKEEIVDGKVKSVKFYVYETLEPHNRMLERHWFHSPADPAPDLYAKLWRDMIFEIPRAIPRTRIPYKETAANLPCKEGQKMWEELQRFDKDRAKNRVGVSKLSSALFLGAQDSTAENVRFLERTDYLLTLNFWPLAVLIYVPWLLDIDPVHPKNSRAEPAGYSLAIPDIQNLESFCQRYPRMLSELRADDKAQGYRPRAVCVDVPAEAGLDLLSRHAELVSQSPLGGTVDQVLYAIEYYHVAKFGNNVKSRGAGRVSANEDLLTEYRRIKKNYLSQLFRSIRLKSLFAYPDQKNRSARIQHWWQAYEKPLSVYPVQLFLSGNRATLPAIACNWCRDVRKAFDDEVCFPWFPDKELYMSNVDEKNPKSTSVSEPRTIEKLIKQVVQNYVRLITEKKTGIDSKTVRAQSEEQKAAASDSTGDATKYPEKSKFEEQRRKTAERLFLEFRSRHDEDFKAYFAEVFGSMPQWSLKNDGSFQLLCASLLERPNDVRTITLLALSASS